MLLLSYLFLIISICLVLKVIGVDDNTMGMFFVLTASIAVIIYVMKMNVSKSIRLIIIAGFVLRIILVFIDVFAVRIVDAGTDDDGFYEASLKLFENGYAGFSDNIYGGFFSKFLSIAYFFVGSSRFTAQYLNVLMYIISAILFVKTILNLGVSERALKICIFIFCLMPNAILNNAVLRRETIMEACICISLLYFSKWYKSKRLLYALLTIIFVALASLFHTALIFGALIFIIYFALYNQEKDAVSFSINKLGKMTILFICAVIAGVGFLSLWNNKFSGVSGMDDIYTTASRARGGSVYLEGYNINSFSDLILFTPLKLFYFIFSPVPWRFRGIMDIISFLLDTLVYVILILKILRSPKNSPAKLMLVTFVAMSTIFALGTFNSGTAIRHRLSLLPYLLVSYSITETMRQSKKKEIKQNKEVSSIKLRSRS